MEKMMPKPTKTQMMTLRIVQDRYQAGIVYPAGRHLTNALIICEARGWLKFTSGSRSYASSYDLTEAGRALIA